MQISILPNTGRWRLMLLCSRHRGLNEIERIIEAKGLRCVVGAKAKTTKNTNHTKTKDLYNNHDENCSTNEVKYTKNGNGE